MRLGLARAAFCALALAGCTVSTDLSPNNSRRVGGENPEVLAALRPVARVDRIELGRTFDGFALSAFGEAPGPGWSQGRLRPRGSGPGPDGVLEFEFVGLPPAPPAEDAAPAPDLPSMRSIRGYGFISDEILRGATGVRVIAAENAVSGGL